MLIKISLISFLVLVLLNITSSIQSETKKTENGKLVITPKIYSNIFLRRREEQKLFVKHLVKAENYEKQYKMLELAFEKILEIINECNMTLHQSEYDAKSGFPNEEKLRDAVTLILENTCLSGDLILHLPDIAYRVLRARQIWKPILNWGIEFTQQFAHIIDEKTAEMLELFRQEINVSERTKDFTNPYRKVEEIKVNERRRVKKARKKIKKGPQLTRTEL